MTGCLIRLLLLPLTVIVIYPLLLLRQPFPTFIFPAEGAEATAVIAGLFIWFAIISYRDVRRYAADCALLNKSLLRDGEKTIVSGSFEPRAPLLTAPFSGKECIGYHYKVTHLTSSAGSGPTRSTDYEGYALVPAVIRSPPGDIKILAESDKELFYEVPLVNLESERERAERYLLACSFGEEIKAPGNFRVDKKIGDPRAIEKCDLEEGVIEPGETVLAAGVYSSENEGITADPDSIMTPFHIVPGGEAALRRKTRNRFLSIAICLGLGCLTLAIYFLKFGNATIY